ncbi:MAG: S41 family peptidase [Gemmatales bacterium]|nr:S41 family peptidase [Gemmatales bacterium]MDW7993309.1 S41 family peptidase [Gemmatales bacterium]
MRPRGWYFVAIALVGLSSLALVGSRTNLAQERTTIDHTVRFARTPDISPDGKWVAFSYLGDIWIVAAEGGTARQVTTHEAHDIQPVFSPDGRWLAFSSNRYGSYDVFVVPFEGGPPRRLTYDSANEMVNDWTPDGRFILFSTRRSPQFPPLPEMYLIPAEGGWERRFPFDDGRDGVFRPDGLELAYIRGPGIWYRKGYRGSSNDDIWICRADGTHHRRLTSFQGQDGSPMWSSDGKWIYYVSEENGVSNIFKRSASGEGAPIQVTRHTQDGVRRARIARNGEWIVYECGFELFRVQVNVPEPQPQLIPITARADWASNPDVPRTFTQGISEYALAPNEQHIAFVVHGEIFLVPSGGGKARNVSNSPAHDRDLAWAPDNKALAFISDRDGEENVYLAESADPAGAELGNARQFRIRRITNYPGPESGVSFSPTGNKLAVLRGGALWVMNRDGSDAKPIVSQGRIIEYSWSPDGRWIVYSRMDAHFASDLYLVPADGGPSTNITRYTTRNFGISWTQDGTRLCFVSQRRNDLDVFLMHLQKPASESKLSSAEPAKASAASGKPEDKPTSKPTEKPAQKPLVIDLEDIHLRVQRITNMSSDEYEAVIRPDGGLVAFRSDALGADDLWLATVTGGQLLRLTTGNLRPRQITWTRSGQLLFLDRDGALRTVRPGVSASPNNPAESGLGRINFQARLRVERGELFRQMFAESWRKLRHHFYDPKLHGTDWDAIRAKYSAILPHVACIEDFYDLISLMLGELNASHLGIGGQQRGAEEQTADLGILWDENYPGPGLRIREILKGGPADRKGIELRAGEYILAIDDTPLTERANLSQLLNDKVGELVRLLVSRTPEPRNTRTIELRPARRQDLVNLYYRRWVEQNRRKVEELSQGRLGYIHLRGMDFESLDEFVRALYTENFDKDGLIIDVRFNGGGFTHDQVLAYLGAKEHTYFVTREGQYGTVLRSYDRKWTKPLVVLCNNRSFSDAEIFPSAVRELGLGKLVGQPTGGLVIGTINEQLIDGSFFRVPRLGVYTLQGVNMEKAGVVPDVIVEPHPDELMRGHDAQLVKAIEVLQQDVRAYLSKRKPAPIPIPNAAEPRP